MAIETHAAPLFKELEDRAGLLETRAGLGEVDREGLRRLIHALKDWKEVVDGRMEQLQTGLVNARGRIQVLEATVVDLVARVSVLEAGG